jgi:hypothetical protein
MSGKSIDKKYSNSANGCTVKRALFKMFFAAKSKKLCHI